MRRYKTAKLAVLILITLITLNSAVLYVLFGINILRPIEPNESTNAAGWKDKSNLNAGSGYNPQWNTGKPQISSSDEGNITSNQGIDSNSSLDSIQSADENKKADEPILDEKPDTEECFLTEAQVSDLDRIDIRDKLSAIAMIAKLGSEDGDTIYDMARNGVTFDELKEIEEILQKYLAAEEIESLKAILEKSVNKD